MNKHKNSGKPEYLSYQPYKLKYEYNVCPLTFVIQNLTGDYYHA